MTASQIINLVHAASTLAMIGLIWFVQSVHYPLFASAGKASFSEFASRHQQRTTALVAPLMLIEAATAILLAISPPQDAVALTSAGCVLLLLIWLSTAFLQVPLHRRLLSDFDQSLIRRLVQTNWIRTGAWSARGCIALLLLAAEMQS